MTYTIHSLALAAALVVTPAEVRAQASDLDTVLDRTVAYVEGYERELGMIIGEEEYVQNATWMDPASRPARVTDRKRRRLKSDFLLLPVDDRWYGVRSVILVDGNRVEAPDELPQSVEDVVSHRTDTQYNIGDFARTFNVPTFPLTFFRTDNLKRFSFEKRGNSRIEGYDTWEIGFSENVSPTLVRGARGQNRYATGRLWIEPGTGRILRTEVEFKVDDPDGNDYSARQRVDYEDSGVLGMLVPDSMEERYSSEFHTVEARADYSDFKRYSVRVDLNPGAIIADDGDIAPEDDTAREGGTPHDGGIID